MSRGGDRVHRTMSYAEEVLSRIERTADGCWLWTGYVLPTGYGQIGQNYGVHRVAWEHLRGPIPRGMVLDHECHNRDLSCNLASKCPHRRCVNPDHLVVTTRGGNCLSGRGFSAVNKRKTGCVNGHEYTPENVYYRPDGGGRGCKTCRAETGDRRRAARLVGAA